MSYTAEVSNTALGLTCCIIPDFSIHIGKIHIKGFTLARHILLQAQAHKKIVFVGLGFWVSHAGGQQH